jgi:hypothetical protein
VAELHELRQAGGAARGEQQRDVAGSSSVSAIRSWLAASRSVNSGLTGVTAAPARSAPSSSKTNSAPFGRRSATTLRSAVARCAALGQLGVGDDAVAVDQRGPIGEADGVAERERGQVDVGDVGRRPWAERHRHSP